MSFGLKPSAAFVERCRCEEEAPEIGLRPISQFAER
jgi:hypothetical protein